MRKMNKIVALSLVLAMALSMMASAASFKDQATINADLIEDINLMVALNVFSEDGTGAGNFEPNTELTRAQVAKLVYVLKNKGVDNKATSWTGMNIFSDVEADSWYEGYVNYCASVGMIAGTGNGMFNPNGKVTSVEFAKLLLVLIGYKADVEGYTGDKWFENIVADAEAAGIFEGYELAIRGTVTREWAAKLMVNAINATKVRYADGELVEMYNDDNQPITFKAQDLGLKEFTGKAVATNNIKLVTANSAANNTNGKNKLSAVGTVSATVLSDTSKTIEFEINPALLGQNVTVLYKGGDNLTNVTKVYGVTAHKDVVSLDTTIDAVEYAADDFNNELVTYVDYVRGSIAKANDGIKNFFGANDGREIKLIDNDGNGTWDIAMYSSVAYDKVEYINATNNVLRMEYNTFEIQDAAKADREDKWENVNFVDTVAKDDIVKITKDFSTGKEITNIELVDVVTGAVSKVANASGSNPTFTIDGTNYKVSAIAVSGFDKDDITIETKAKDFFVDGKYIVYSDAIAGNALGQTNIAFVIDSAEINDGWSTTKMVDILKNDGTREKLTYKVPTSAENAIAWENVAGREGKIVEFVMNDGKVYFKPLVTEGDTTVNTLGTGHNFKFDKSEMKFTDGSAKYLVNDDTFFFVKDGTKYAVMSGSEIAGDMNAMDWNFYAYNNNGLPYLRYAVLSGEIPTGEESKGSAIASTTINTEFEEDGDKIHKLEVTKLDGTVVTLVALATENEFSGMTGKMIEYEIGSNGYATVEMWGTEDGDRDYIADAVEFVDEDGDEVMLVSGGYKAVADDAKIYFVDAYLSGTTHKIMVSEGDVINEAAEDVNGNLVNNVLYKLNSDGEISHIIVEVDGELIWTDLYTANAHN
ncbi:MAG: S-layer homology domain-containing protein [Ruminococcaceae bacterium]|nr:S-layer homology domain-containing protein [Oscillospiraceae bacterium]